MKKYRIDPISKPRMTKRDKWLKRPCVQKYWQYKALVRESGITLPEGNFHVTFILPMPKSWGRKKRDLMRGKPHQQKPDKDNLEKGLLDAIFDEDCRVWDSRVTKLWGEEGEIWLDQIN
jgi:Holliday junction resolvase RusA-like endonuclease